MFMSNIPVHQLTSKDGVTILKDGCTHKLIIQSCNDADEGLYEFEVNGCRTQAMVKVGGIYIMYACHLKKERVIANINKNPFLHNLGFSRSSRIRS